ncbi:MAG: M15 family metallopeptidase, partial [Candidatus Dormibacteraeota bacterium]|nr:M15 family metallopeptidase [Candidatus Dormibacteraeota bacterium]
MKARPAVEAAREDHSKIPAGKTLLDRPGEPFRLGGDWALSPARLLDLQRLAGNASVAALFSPAQRAVAADVVAQEPVALAPADPVIDIVLDIVDAAAQLVGTPQGTGIWDLIRRQFTNRSARSAKASKDTGALAAFTNVLYDKGLAGRINKLKKAQKQKALEHIFSAFGAAADVKQAHAGARAGSASVADEFSQLKKTALGDYVKSDGAYAGIRTGLLGAFGALEVGTAQALQNAQDYYGTMVPVSTFIEKSLGWAAHVHPDMATAIALAEQKLNALREEKAAQMNPRAASWWFKGVQDSINNFGDGVSIRANANNALELSLHSYGWAIDVNASMNPNIPGFPRALVKELTGSDVFTSSSGQSEGNFARGKPAAGVRDEAQRLADASSKFAGAFADEDSLKQAMLRVINGRLGSAWANQEIDVIYPLVLAAVQAGKDKKKPADKAAARAAALDALTGQIR